VKGGKSDQVLGRVTDLGLHDDTLGLRLHIYKASASAIRYSWARSWKSAIYGKQNGRQLPILIQQSSI
jgi:hypothetical protein